jgi:hypothetical protein
MISTKERVSFLSSLELPEKGKVHVERSFKLPLLALTPAASTIDQTPVADPKQ